MTWCGRCARACRPHETCVGCGGAEDQAPWLDERLLADLMDNRDEPVSETEALRDGFGYQDEEEVA